VTRLPEAGRAPHAHESARDTDRERLFRELAEHLPDAVFAMDRELRFTYWNAASVVLAGMPADGAIGKSLFDLFPRARGSALETAYRRVLDTGVTEELEYPYELAGRPLLFRITAYAITSGIAVHARDVTERRRLEDEITAISARERARIAAELHDELGQDLAAAGYLIGALRQELDARDPRRAAGAKGIEALVATALVKTRHLARGLYPVTLGPAGLVGALEELASDVQHLYGAECTVEAENGIDVGDVEHAEHVCRIVREAVSNAMRHGGATHVAVHLEARDGHVSVTIADDGKGLAHDDEEGLGIRIMRYRAHALGGSLSIDQRDGGGTMVTCRFPARRTQGQDRT